MSKEFVWTDELVKEYVAHVIIGRKECSVTTAQEHINQFKESKKQPPQSKERVEVLGIEYTEHSFEFTTSRSFDFNKFPLIKAAIESVLNNEPNITGKEIQNIWDERLGKKYTEKEVKEIERNAFERSRYGISGAKPPYRYPTFEDYIKSKNKKA